MQIFQDMQVSWYIKVIYWASAQTFFVKDFLIRRTDRAEPSHIFVSYREIFVDLQLAARNPVEYHVSDIVKYLFFVFVCHVKIRSMGAFNWRMHKNFYKSETVR